MSTSTSRDCASLVWGGKNEMILGWSDDVDTSTSARGDRDPLRFQEADGGPGVFWGLGMTSSKYGQSSTNISLCSPCSPVGQWEGARSLTDCHNELSLPDCRFRPHCASAQATTPRCSSHVYSSNPTTAFCLLGALGGLSRRTHSRGSAPVADKADKRTYSKACTSARG